MDSGFWFGVIFMALLLYFYIFYSLFLRDDRQKPRNYIEKWERDNQNRKLTRRGSSPEASE